MYSVKIGQTYEVWVDQECLGTFKLIGEKDTKFVFEHFEIEDMRVDALRRVL